MTVGTTDPVRCTVLPVPEPASDPHPAPGELRVNRRGVDNVLVVRVAGEIDLRTAPDLQEALGESLEQMKGGRVVVDLSAVTFLGSAGLAALAQAAKQADDHESELRIVVGSNHLVRRPIELMGLDHVLVLCADVQEAVRDMGEQD
jgi:anti-sigma B factor antagonist